MKGEGEGEPENEAHTTAHPVSSDDTKDDCSNLTVPGTAVHSLKEENIVNISCRNNFGNVS